MTWVLGIGSSHDSSAALFRDGTLVAAVSEERLSRIKCDGSQLPQRAIDEVLRMGGITRGDVDHIALIYGFFPDKYFIRESWGKELEARMIRLRKRLAGKEPYRHVNANDLLRRLLARGEDIVPYFRTQRFLRDEGFSARAKVRFYDHHLTHAAAAAFYSGLSDAAVITIDGVGDLNIHMTASTFNKGELRRILMSDVLGTSPGEFYGEVTIQLGFLALRHEGKVLGLAAFGDPSKLSAEMLKSFRLSADGHRFDSDFAGQDSAHSKRRAHIRQAIAGYSREDVAAATQKVFEDTIVAFIRQFIQETGKQTIAANGGVFANVKLNQRIASIPGVKQLFIFPAMSDTGNSVGAALLYLNDLDSRFFANRQHKLESVYWGPAYDDGAIQASLESRNLSYHKLSQEELIEKAAQAIHAGQVVGWFQGRMEFGPRALGNRSMVARPTDSAINSWLNARLDRTEFMPFAPSVLAEHAAAIFENIDTSAHAAEFMTVTYDVKPEWHDRIPAVVHVDGTARPQFVTQGANPRYHQLIERYRQLSGIPLVLNTSFNVHEEPIVCRPEEAIRAFEEKRVDCLAVGNFWLE